MCPPCQERLGTEEEERTPIIDAATGTAVFEMRKVPYGSNPFRVINNCCSKSENFITPKLPLLEAVFRLFLANGNQQLDLKQICEYLQARFAAAGAFRDISPQKLKRLLDNDCYYGLRRFTLPEEPSS